jgi:hypothetical protein
VGLGKLAQREREREEGGDLSDPSSRSELHSLVLLTVTWLQVPRPSFQLFEVLSKLLDPHNNRFIYRQKLHAVDKVVSRCFKRVLLCCTTLCVFTMRLLIGG